MRLENDHIMMNLRGGPRYNNKFVTCYHVSLQSQSAFMREIHISLRMIAAPSNGLISSLPQEYQVRAQKMVSYGIF